MSKIAERTGIIWIPEDPLDLLAVSLDGSYTDENSIKGMLAINQSGRDWLNGQIDTTEYLDRLEYHGVIDPFELLDEFADHIEFITGG